MHVNPAHICILYTGLAFDQSRTINDRPKEKQQKLCIDPEYPRHIVIMPSRESAQPGSDPTQDTEISKLCGLRGKLSTCYPVSQVGKISNLKANKI